MIVGAAKAGTTSLYEYVRQHPRVFMPAVKEPSYFTEGYGLATLDEYLDLFDVARADQVVGESSGSYLSSEESPAWIRSALGAIKVIIILRNPARRAFSLYVWMAQEGYERAATFAEALALEEERKHDPSFRDHPPQFFHDYMYLSSGFYYEQVKRFIDLFGRESVLVLLFEEFVRDPVAACRQVFGLIGVDDTFTPTIERHNEGKLPRSIRAQYLLRNAYRLAPWLRPGRVRDAVCRAGISLNLRLGRAEKPTMSPQTYDDLMSRFAPDIDRLSQLIGRDLSIWTKRESR